MSDAKDVEILFAIRDEMSAQAAKITDALKDLKDETEEGSKTAKKADSAWGGLQKQLLGFASVGAVVVAFKQIIDVGSQFEKQMSNIKAVVQPTGAEFDKLKAKAMDLGAKTAFSASQAADAFAELGKLGMTTNQIIASSGSVLALAAAGQVELAASATLTAQTLNQFGLAATDAARVADVIAQSSNVSALDVWTFAEAMKYAGTAAKLSNTSLEETTSLLAILHDNGIEGSMAGTSLNEMFTRLSGAYDNVNDKMKTLGVENGTFTEKMKALSAAGIGQAEAFKLFGEQGSRAFGIIGPNIDKMDKLTESFINAKGAAEEMARVQSDNFAGASDNLSSSIENLGIVIFDAFGAQAKDGINNLSSILVELADNLKENPEVIKGVADAMVGLLSATANVVAFLVKNADVLALTGLAVGLVYVIPLIAEAKVAFLALTASMNVNPIIAAATALAALTMAVNAYSDSVDKQADKRATWFEDAKNIEAAKSSLVALKAEMMDPAVEKSFKFYGGDLKAAGAAGDKVQGSQKSLMSATGSGSMYEALGVGAKEFKEKWGKDIAWTEATLDRSIKQMEQRLAHPIGGSAAAQGATTVGGKKATTAAGGGGDDAGKKAVDAVLKEIERVNTDGMKLNMTAQSFELKQAEDKWSRLLSGLEKGSAAYKTGYAAFQQDLANINKEYSDKEAAQRETARQSDLAAMQKNFESVNAATQAVYESGYSTREREMEGVYAKWDSHLAAVDSGSKEEQEILDARDAEIRAKGDQFAEEDKKKSEEIRDKKLDDAMQYVQAAQSVADSVSQLSSAMLERRVSDIDRETAKDKDRINASKMSEKDKQKALAALEAEASKRKYEAAVKDWKLNLLMSVVNTALGVTRTIASVGFPAAIPMLIAQGVASAVAIGTLIANKPQMADGGIVAGDNWGDRTLVGLNGGELVANTQQQQIIADVISGKSRGAAGGVGNVTFGAPQIVIQGNTDRDTVKKITDVMDNFRESVLESLYSSSARGEIDYTKLQLQGA